MISLNDLINEYSDGITKSIAQDLLPKKYAFDYVIPYLGEEASLKCLSFKHLWHSPIQKKTCWEDVERRYYQLDSDLKSFLAYNLSHELRIATLAALLAFNKPKAKVFEIGPAFGLSSIHFSHYFMEIFPRHPSQTPHFTAIELHAGVLEKAKEIKIMTGDYAGPIKYTCGDSNRILRKELSDFDTVFASIAEPNVIIGLIKIMKKRKFDMVLSFSAEAEKNVVRNNQTILELMDKKLNYYKTRFEDVEYNRTIKNDIKKYGVLIKGKKN